MSDRAARGDVADLRNRASKLRNDALNTESKDEALEKILAAAEMSMQALKITDDAAVKKDLNVNIKRLLSEAETIKASPAWKPSAPSSADSRARPSSPTIAKVKRLKVPRSSRQLSTAEKIIILKASTLNGSKFPPWQQDPLTSEFKPDDNGQLFTEAATLKLSDRQAKDFDGWKRPAEALPPPTLRSDARDTPPPTMAAYKDTDLVQDAATDCSVVASFSASLARTNKGHYPLLATAFFPVNQETDLPELSASGKYVFRFNFNGSDRRVEIDDRLPVSKSSRVIHVLDRKNPSVLWPALLEKAYLKVRGGYDFLGSNSATDLWVTIGWIPEKVFLTSEDVSIHDVWTKVYNAHSYGDVLATCGTGKMSERAERQIGLAAEHDYAIIDMREVDGQKFMLIKNPWCEGSAWHDSRLAETFTSSTQNENDGAVMSPRDLLNSQNQLSPGTFWMDINNIAQYFETIYLNWNPGLFQYRQDIHFSWDLSKSGTPNSLARNPQFAFSVEKGKVAWLLLSRHFQDVDSLASKPGYINLYVYDAHGTRVFLNEMSIARASFVDSHENLLRLDDLRPGHRYTVAIVQDELAKCSHTFSLHAFSNSAIYLEQAADKLPCQTRASSSWVDDTAGGNTHSPLYSRNPQFSLEIPSSTPLQLFIEADDARLPIHVKLVHGRGNRVQSIRSRDIVFDSKDHRRGCAFGESRNVDPGKYTVICSTFEPGQTADFVLRIHSAVPTRLVPLPREGAGRLKMNLGTVIFERDQQRLAAPLKPQKLTKFAALVRHQASSSMPSPVSSPVDLPQTGERSMIRIAIESWSGRIEPDKVLTTSADGDFSDSRSGVLTNELDLSPAMIRDAGLWLIIERMFSAKHLVQEAFVVNIYVESPQAVVVGDWRCLDD